MTSINTFEDILQAMEQNPALRDAMRRHVLTEELLQLPARVFRLEELVADIAAKMSELTGVFAQFMEQTNLALARLDERQDRLETDVASLQDGQARLETDVASLQDGQARLETDVASLQEGQARLETNVASLQDGQARLETDVASLKEGQARLETEVASLKEGQARLETDVASLKEGQARLETDVASLQEGQARLETDVDSLQEGQARLEQGQARMFGQLGNLIGSDYERKAARLAGRRLRQQLGVSQAEILRAITVPDKLDLTNLLDRAAEAGAVSSEEADDVELADLVLRGLAAGETAVHVVAEVSLTIQDEDIRRAARRAAILGRATGGPTRPAVIGESISDAGLELAAEEQVAFIQLESQ